MNPRDNVPRISPHLSPRKLYSVVHETCYQYQRNVTLSQQCLHLSPRSFDYQDVLSQRVEIEPATPDCADHLDYFGNAVKSVTIATPHRTLIVRAMSSVALQPRPNGDQIQRSMSWEAMRDHLRNSAEGVALEPLQFLFDSPHVACNVELARYAASSFTPGRPVLEAALDLTERIYSDFEFDPLATTIATPLADVLKGRRGVCQDFAHLMIGCLRTLGLACRYVSGYLLTTPPPGVPRMVGADASHAWVSVYCRGFGWIDFDPTNRCLVQNEHITLGWGRDFSDVTPMRGVVLGGGGQDLSVSVTVSPVAQA